MRRAVLFLLILAACRLRAPDGPEDLPPNKKAPAGATREAVVGYPVLTQEVSFYFQGTGPLETQASARAWLSKVSSMDQATKLTPLLEKIIEDTDFSSSRLFVFYGESPQLPEVFRVERDVIVFSHTATCPGGMAPPRAVVVMRVPQNPRETKVVSLGSTAGCPTDIP